MRVIDGYRVGKFVPENVLEAFDLTTRTNVRELVRHTAPFDVVNKGYLSRDEFERGAAVLSRTLASRPTTMTIDGYRVSRKSIADARGAILAGMPAASFSDQRIVAAAARWGDGSRYLTIKEIEAGCYELQALHLRGALTESDVDVIRHLTGLDRLPDGEIAHQAFQRLERHDRVAVIIDAQMPVDVAAHVTRTAIAKSDLPARAHSQLDAALATPYHPMSPYAMGWPPGVGPDDVFNYRLESVAAVVVGEHLVGYCASLDSGIDWEKGWIAFDTAGRVIDSEIPGSPSEY